MHALLSRGLKLSYPSALVSGRFLFFVFFVCFFVFLGLRLRHMEVPRLEAELEP